LSTACSIIWGGAVVVIGNGFKRYGKEFVGIVGGDFHESGAAFFMLKVQALGVYFGYEATFDKSETVVHLSLFDRGTFVARPQQRHKGGEGREQNFFSHN
jgi:hypothetical protein